MSRIKKRVRAGRTCSFLIALFVVTSLAQDATNILEQDINLPKSVLIQEILDELINNPLDLNTATSEDLLSIPYLTPVVIHKIIETRNSIGMFKSVSELVKISEIDNELLEKIRPFLSVKPISDKTSCQIRLKVGLDTLSRFNQFRHWETNSRITFSSYNDNANLRFVMLTDKDINETRYADFFSTSISISTKNNKLILGNYLLNFGSQLLFIGPYAYLSSVKNFSLEPLKSINELTNAYEHSSLFGISYFQAIANFGIYSFVSSSRLDADIRNGLVRRVYYYARYDDSVSQARRDQLREDLIGFRIVHSTLSNNLLVGATVYHSNFDKRFEMSDSSGSFYGQRLDLFGFDVQSKYNNYFMKTEVGYCLKNGLGAATQIIGDWRFMKVNLSLYTQEKDFFSPHSKWKSLTNRKDRVTGSFNIFYNLYGFKMYLLTSTREDFTTDSLPARLQYRIERTQNRFDFILALKGNYKETNLNTYGTRFDIVYHLNKRLEIFSRIEDKYQKDRSKSGRLFGLGSKYKTSFVSVESRFYCFDVLSSDCKIYAYEPMSGSYGFLGRGIRVSAKITTQIENLLNLILYFGYTFAPQKNFNTTLQIERKF